MAFPAALPVLTTLLTFFAGTSAFLAASTGLTAALFPGATFFAAGAVFVTALPGAATGAATAAIAGTGADFPFP